MSKFHDRHRSLFLRCSWNSIIDNGDVRQQICCSINSTRSICAHTFIIARSKRQTDKGQRKLLHIVCSEFSWSGRNADLSKLAWFANRKAYVDTVPTGAVTGVLISKPEIRVMPSTTSVETACWPRTPFIHDANNNNSNDEYSYIFSDAWIGTVESYIFLYSAYSKTTENNRKVCFVIVCEKIKLN